MGEMQIFALRQITEEKGPENHGFPEAFLPSGTPPGFYPEMVAETLKMSPENTQKRSYALAPEEGQVVAPIPRPAWGEEREGENPQGPHATEAPPPRHTFSGADGASRRMVAEVGHLLETANETSEFSTGGTPISTPTSSDSSRSSHRGNNFALVPLNQEFGSDTYSQGAAETGNFQSSSFAVPPPVIHVSALTSGTSLIPSPVEAQLAPGFPTHEQTVAHNAFLDEYCSAQSLLTLGLPENLLATILDETMRQSLPGATPPDTQVRFPLQLQGPGMRGGMC